MQKNLTWYKVDQDEAFIAPYGDIALLKCVAEILFGFFEIIIKHVLSANIIPGNKLNKKLNPPDQMAYCYLYVTN